MNEVERRHAVDKVLERERWYRMRRAEERVQEPLRRAMFIGGAVGLGLGVLIGQGLFSHAFLAPVFIALCGLATGVGAGVWVVFARERAAEKAREAEQAKEREAERMRRREEARKRRNLPKAKPPAKPAEAKTRPAETTDAEGNEPLTPDALTPDAPTPDALTPDASAEDDFLVPPGFYPDPAGEKKQRWWDGAAWTDRYAADNNNGQPLPRSARRVAKALHEHGHEGAVRLLSDSARSAAEAAAALGVQQRQIVKSLVFRGRESGEPLLALVDGDARVSTTLLEVAAGEPVERPDGDWVKKRVGFAIGGVPPLGLATDVKVFADPALVELPELWAAAGTPHAVFSLTGEELVDLTGAELEPIAGSDA